MKGNPNRPESFGVEPSDVGNAVDQFGLQHVQAAVRLLRHGQQQSQGPVQSSWNTRQHVLSHARTSGHCQKEWEPGSESATPKALGIVWRDRTSKNFKHHYNIVLVCAASTQQCTAEAFLLD